MSDLLKPDDRERIVMNFAQAAHEQAMAAQNAEAERSMPHVLMRPRLFIDGKLWCALYGENLQDGVAGFGKSPHEAVTDFNKNWFAHLPTRQEVEGK